MNPRVKIGVACFAVVVLGWYLFHTSVTVAGSSVVVNQGLHHVEGQLRPEATYQYVLKDKGVALNTFSGDAFLSALPLERADALKAQHGDFFRCDSPGARAAQSAVQGVVLLASDPSSRGAISEAMKLVAQSQNPVVTFKASEVRVTRQTWLRMNVNDATGTRFFYVKDLTVTKPKYM